MSALRIAPPPPRAEVRRSLRAAVGRLGRPLRVLAEDVAGLDGPIDLVTADPGGGVVLVLVGGEGEELELVAHGLAQRAWLRPRLRDWQKLAPELDIRPDEGIDLVLVAPEWEERARAAASEADRDGILLVRLRFVDDGTARPEILLESLPRGLSGDGGEPARALRSRFRSGLRDLDLGGPVATDLPEG